MVLPANHTLGDFDPRFKIFHELMQTKVSEILLVSALYDACIMEVDGQLAEDFAEATSLYERCKPYRENAPYEIIRLLGHRFSWVGVKKVS
jgi:hypothetical protein